MFEFDFNKIFLNIQVFVFSLKISFLLDRETTSLDIHI